MVDAPNGMTETSQHPDPDRQTTTTNGAPASTPSEMAQPDSELSDDELLSLYRDDSSHGSSYLLRRNFARALAAAGIADVDHVDIVLDDEDPAEPALAVLPVAEDEVEYAMNARKVSDSGESAEVRVPPDVLGGGSHPGGVPSDLGLDLDDYSNENKLLFEPVIGDGFLLLLPERWENGDAYVAPTSDEDPEQTSASDAEAPGDAESGSRHGIGSESTGSGDAVEAPIASTALQTTVQMTGVAEDALEDALLAVDDVAESLVEDGVPWQMPVQYPPLDAVVDEQAVTIHFVPKSAWNTIRTEARGRYDGTLSDAVVDAAEMVHVSTARDAIEQAGVESHRHFEADYAALVLYTDP